MSDPVLAPLQEIGGGLAQAFGLGLLPTQLNPTQSYLSLLGNIFVFDGSVAAIR